MVVPLAAATAGALATAAYLDAKYFFRHDWNTVWGGPWPADPSFVQERQRAGCMLNYHVLEEYALRRSPNKPWIIFEGKTWTFRQFYDDVQRVGNWLLNELGVARHEIVALDGQNSVEYLVLYFALDGIGAVPALINANVSARPLVHAVKLAEARYLFVDAEIASLVEGSAKELESAGVTIQYFDSAWLASVPSGSPLPRDRQQGFEPTTLKCLMYTSGTTGLPKGIVITAGRSIFNAYTVFRHLNLEAKDRFYICMPLYHGTALGLGVLPALKAGASVVLSRKFSHSTFWPDVSNFKANIIIYVGEMARYLVNASPHPLERKHCVKMAWGNGMRTDIWEQFRQRFGIEIIHELYASTDGIAPMTNPNRGEFTRGAVGLHGLFWHLTKGRREIRARVDPVTQELVRDPKTGFCIKLRPGDGEPGEILTRTDDMQYGRFTGYYKNDAAEQGRYVSDVFQKGDTYFRSGDLLQIDADGRHYFVDRLGDTFRWKSENVSTSEVADAMGQHPQINEASVYGVEVPHAVGRAGCAAVVLKEGLADRDVDWASVAKLLQQSLPRYAVPIFLRTVGSLEHTTTMKIQKGKLREEGLDVAKARNSGHQMWWLPPGGTRYEHFEEKDLKKLQSGQVKL